ncbi:uncharacterized protein [Narcine bancroftii]|uniref:uncharacterized protein isoform X5 n=1 Tax=Narcine bancroftii TaxID=1343680 RepID=UPI003831F371
MLVTGECQLLKISRRINSLRMMMSHVLQVKVQIYCHMFQEHWKDVEALRNSLHRRLSHYKAQPHHCRGCSRNSAMYDCNKYHKTQQISRAVKFREAIFWTCIRCYKKVWINRTGRNLEINGDTVVTTLSDPLKSSSSSLFGGEQFKMAWEPLEHCMMIMQKTCKNCEGMHYLRSNLHCKPPLCKKKCSFHFGIISHFKPK